jgi:hypothetical protein
MRGVGEALAQISLSEATAERNPGPDVGTPDRIKGQREAS